MKRQAKNMHSGFIIPLVILGMIIVMILVSGFCVSFVGSRQGVNHTGEMINDEIGDDPNETEPIEAPSGPCAQRIVQIAANEVGAYEVPDGSNRGPNNSPSDHGITNYFKHGSNNSQPWCAYFATWVLQQADDNIPTIASASGVYQYYNRKGQAFTKASVLAGKNTPQPGDIFVKNLDGSGHIGIVASYADGVIQTIEGNSSDKVRRGREVISVSNGDVKGFGRPKCQ